ncbi:hypothetical protein E2C01_003344 [Portunus trituberculatus]|uniref:Uncharacterized protein n=1 Tax=Portunus trituberculatus TaxID=210409 RepID=A0A5B7CPY1_PORTR|nr:hypothetical protein [Portunus trituberculatus]
MDAATGRREPEVSLMASDSALHCPTREKSTSIRLRIYKGVCEGSGVASRRPGRGLGVETDHTGQTSLLMMSDPFEM